MACLIQRILAFGCILGLPKNTSVFSGKEREREAAAADAAALAVKLLGDKTGDEALAKSSETGALKRLQREAFADLLKVRERLDKLEHHTGLRRSKAASGEDSTGPAKTHLKGEVNAGTAFVLMEDNSSRCSRAAIVQAGLHTGLDIRFTFETPFREKDLLLTQCTAGHSGSDRSILGGPISITKIIYSAHVTDDLTVMVAPLGAHGSDMTEIVNPLQVGAFVIPRLAEILAPQPFLQEIFACHTKKLACCSCATF
jgi:hypothetical protein